MIALASMPCTTFCIVCLYLPAFCRVCVFVLWTSCLLTNKQIKSKKINANYLTKHPRPQILPLRPTCDLRVACLRPLSWKQQRTQRLYRKRSNYPHRSFSNNDQINALDNDNYHAKRNFGESSVVDKSSCFPLIHSTTAGTMDGCDVVLNRISLSRLGCVISVKNRSCGRTRCCNPVSTVPNSRRCSTCRDAVANHVAIDGILRTSLALLC